MCASHSMPRRNWQAPSHGLRIQLSVTVPFTIYITMGRLSYLMSLSLCVLICKTGIKKRTLIGELWGWNAIIYEANVPQCLAYSKCSITTVMVMTVWSHSLINITNKNLPVTSWGCKELQEENYSSSTWRACQQPPSAPQVQSHARIFVANHIFCFPSSSLGQHLTYPIHHPNRTHLKTIRPKLGSHLEWLILNSREGHQ